MVRTRERTRGTSGRHRNGIPNTVAPSLHFWGHLVLSYGMTAEAECAWVMLRYKAWARAVCGNGRAWGSTGQSNFKTGSERKSWSGAHSEGGLTEGRGKSVSTC